MTRVRVILLVAAIALWPGRAYAANGFWAWLEELSGPRPFRGYVFSAPVLCRDDGGLKDCGRVLQHPRQQIVLRAGWFDSRHNLRFKDLPDTAENRENVNVLF